MCRNELERERLLASGDGMETANRDTKLGLQIASRLRDEIVAGQLPVGSALRLASLADRLGVSTTPVREALTILERQGLVISQLHRGFRVAEITPKEIAALYNVHAYMSELLAERRRAGCPKRTSTSSRSSTRRCARRRPRATRRSPPTSTTSSTAASTARPGCRCVVRFLSETTPFVARRQDPDIPGWEEQRLEGHHAIIEALRKRDSATVAELVGEQIRRSGELASAFASCAERRDARDGRSRASSDPIRPGIDQISSDVIFRSRF